tara:strand:- start:149 stop:373 length:225 start_codon:yes stop_codon:yes gene_type:complete
MYRSYKITDFQVGDYLYKFEKEEWINYGKIVLQQGQVFGIRSNKFDGIMMIRKDLVYGEGFIASSNLLDNQQED